MARRTKDDATVGRADPPLGRPRPRRLAAQGAHQPGACTAHDDDQPIINWLLDPTAFDLVKVGTRAFDANLAGLAHPTLAAVATRART